MLFSHDGIHDSQTHLASPQFFYEQLRRELALSSRTTKPISLIKIKFNSTHSDRVDARDILYFSSELTQLARSEDCIGRLGINEVVIIVRDGNQHGKRFVDRLSQSKSLTVKETLQIHISTVTAFDDEDALSLLQRLDAEVTLSN